MNSDSSPPAKARAGRASAERHALPAYQERSRETRARILAAAEQEFAESGYDGTRIADIAARAGCSVGAVYFRFKDKSALFLAIAESFAEDARGNLGRALEDGADAETLVRHFVRNAAISFRRHKGLFRAIVERGLEHPRAMQAMFALRDEFARSLETLLARRGGRDHGLCVRVMTQMIYGFLLTGVLNARAPARIDDARTVEELAKACIAYMRGDLP